MRTRRNGHQMRSSPLLAIDGGDELVEDVIVHLVLSKADNVYVHLLLLQLLGELDDVLFISFNRRTGKCKIKAFFAIIH